MFENLGKKLGDMAQSAAKKSGEVVEVTKLNLEIKSEEDNIEKLFTEIGKLYYSSMEAGTQLDVSASDMCKKIKEHKDKIAELKEKIKYIKNSEEQQNS